MALISGVEVGFISKWALMVNCLPADAWGRQAMEDGFVNAAKCSSALKVRVRDTFLDCLATDTDGVRVDEDLSVALPIVFTITTQPDVPRSLTYILTHANITAYILVIVGVNARGETVTETFTEVHASPWARTTNNAFAKITSITLTARTGTGVGDLCDVGISDNLGLSNPIAAAASVYKISKNAADMPVADYLPEAVYHTVNVSVGAGIVAGDDFCISYATPLSLAS